MRKTTSNRAEDRDAGALEGRASRRRASAVGMYPDMGILREVVTQKAPRRAEGTLRARLRCLGAHPTDRATYQ